MRIFKDMFFAFGDNSCHAKGMRRWITSLLLLALLAIVSPQTATAATTVCTPLSGTEPWNFPPGFAMLNDGRIVVGGIATYNDEPTPAGVILGIDGGIELNLSVAIAPMSIFRQQQTDILVEPNGDIVMSGGFQVLDANNTEVSRFITRFDGATGQLDTTMLNNLGTTSSGTATALARQADGRLIVGGSTAMGGIAWPRIGRLAADGSADTSAPTFATNVGGTLNGVPRDIAVRSDDRVWVGGNFTGGVRLFDSGGTPISIGTTDGEVRAVLNRQGDTVLLGGAFTTFTATTSATTSANNVVALNADGTLDTTFNTNVGSGANGAVWSLSEQSDGKILLAGEFTNFSGVSVSGVARINADGTPDTAFNTSVGTQDIFGSQPWPYIHHVGTQPDGKIILFGYISPTDPTHGALAPGLARLSPEGILDHRFNADCIAVPAPPRGLDDPIAQPVATTPTTTTTISEPITSVDLPDAAAIAAVTPSDLGSPPTITAGSTITLTGSGFTPQENVVVFIASQRRILSQAKADSTGTVTATFTADSNLSGDQIVVMWEPASGSMRTQAIAVAATALPATGSTNWAPWSLLLTGLGALVLGLRRLDLRRSR
jgi:uncharacterized delta-60 repeat protein